MKSIVIDSQQWQLHLRSDLGGSIESLSYGGVDILHGSAPGQLNDVRLAASYPLVPYSNRIAQAQLHWGGQIYPLEKNFPGEAHCLHGVGWQRAWQLSQHSENACELHLECPASSAWPFAFETVQSFQVQGNTLLMTMSITNRASQPAPVGLGWHPYFIKRKQTKLQFAAQGMWDMNALKLPSRLLPSTGIDQDCAQLDVDNCFDQWDGQVLLTDECMLVQLQADVSRLVVYTTPTLDAIAIEPVSHVNNAMNAGNPKDSVQQGVVILEPGQSHTINMRMTVDLR